MTTYSATSTYGYCQYTVLADQTLEGFVTFYDLTTVSAAHIHSAVDGEPILVWLATSKQWETGVAQATALANCPCCVPGACSNPTCSLQSPPGTPRTKRCSRTTYFFQVSPPVCGNTDSSGCGICPWISQGTVLNFHGYDFQYVKNGCPTGGSPGADMLESVPFTLIVTQP